MIYQLARLELLSYNTKKAGIWVTNKPKPFTPQKL